MWNASNWTRRAPRRRAKVRRIMPMLEVAEPRIVLSTGAGFIQGTVFVNNSSNQVGNPNNNYPNPFDPSTAGTVVAGATIDLYQGSTVPSPSTTPYLTTTSATDGSYSFSGLASGTYTVVEIPPTG